jgi:hypothetical protein
MPQDGGFYPTATSFEPRSELLRMDADTVLIFLSGNGVVYEVPMDDDWYRGTHPFRNLTGIGTDNFPQTFRPEDAASPMGCIQQFQFCLADETSCGPLAASYDASAQAFESIGLSKSEAYNDTFSTVVGTNNPTSSRLQWLISLVRNQFDIRDILTTSGSQALASRTQLSGGLQASLPLDQWKLDIQHTWATAFARLQAEVVQVAYGTTDPSLIKYRVGPGDAAQANICSNQVPALCQHLSSAQRG